MADKIPELTKTDMIAVESKDSNYINNKGAKLYTEGKYAEAIEYYRLAAAMGNIQSVSNLGYCYLYGRSIEPDVPRAVAYFRAAASCGNADAAYKLGDIYGRDKWGLEDKELSVYYYRMAASMVIGSEWEGYSTVLWCEELDGYPSLCYALGREFSGGGNMTTNLDLAYQFLIHAETGYRAELENGAEMYRKCYEGVKELMADPQFDRVREKYREENEDTLTD